MRFGGLTQGQSLLKFRRLRIGERARSSAVEHPTFNRTVLGSIPSVPTTFPIKSNTYFLDTLWRFSSPLSMRERSGLIGRSIAMLEPGREDGLLFCSWR